MAADSHRAIANRSASRSSAGDRSIDEIETEIALVRVDLGLTLDALAVELAPNHLVAKATTMITQTLYANRPVGSASGGGFRVDPLPLALIGLGVAWLVAENAGLIEGILPGLGGSAANPAPATGLGAKPADQRIERIVGRTGAPAIDAERGDPGGGWIHQAMGAACGALRSIRDGGGTALERAGEYLDGAAQPGGSARRAGARLIDRIERNPLLFGVIGIACGAVLAAFAPASRGERELVADAREDLWEKAEELGHQAAESVRALAPDSTGAAAPGRAPGSFTA